MFQACTVFRFYGAVFFACSEHKNKQDDDKERKVPQNGGINNFFHVKNNDFVLELMRVTPDYPAAVLRRSAFFISVCLEKEKYACYLRDKEEVL